MSETPNTTPSPQALLAANAIAEDLGSDGDAIKECPEFYARVIDKHTQSAALATSLAKTVQWTEHLAKFSGCELGGPCLSDVAEAKALLKSIE
jgi:hypothetical protein